MDHAHQQLNSALPVHCRAIRKARIDVIRDLQIGDGDVGVGEMKRRIWSDLVIPRLRGSKHNAERGDKRIHSLDGSRIGAGFLGFAGFCGV
jgi:hypothetical protein